MEAAVAQEMCHLVRDVAGEHQRHVPVLDFDVVVETRDARLADRDRAVVRLVEPSEQLSAAGVPSAGDRTERTRSFPATLSRRSDLGQKVRTDHRPQQSEPRHALGSPAAGQR